jgi:hypothetical protein
MVDGLILPEMSKLSYFAEGLVKFFDPLKMKRIFALLGNFYQRESTTSVRQSKASNTSLQEQDIQSPVNT